MAFGISDLCSLMLFVYVCEISQDKYNSIFRELILHSCFSLHLPYFVAAVF